MLKERHDIGKGFMQRQNVEIGRFVEAAVHAIENGVSGLVRDDVVREAGVNGAAGSVVARIVLGSLKITQQQRDFRRAVIRIGFVERVRADL